MGKKTDNIIMLAHVRAQCKGSVPQQKLPEAFVMSDLNPANKLSSYTFGNVPLMLVDDTHQH